MHSTKTCVVGCVDLLLCRVAALLFKQRVRRFLKRGSLFRVLRKHFVHGLVRRLVRGVLLMLLHVLFAVLRVLRLIDNCAALLLVRRRNVQRITAALRKRKDIGRPAVLLRRSLQHLPVQLGGVLHRLAVRRCADLHIQRFFRRCENAVCQLAVQAGLNRDRLRRLHLFRRFCRQHVYRQNTDNHDKRQNQADDSFFHSAFSFFIIFVCDRIENAISGVYTQKSRRLNHFRRRLTFRA